MPAVDHKTYKRMIGGSRRKLAVGLTALGGVLVVGGAMAATTLVKRPAASPAPAVARVISSPSPGAVAGQTIVTGQGLGYRPSVTGLNGDVHAGGTMDCNATSSGNIRTGTSNSFSQFVVSASGNTGSFGSANSTTGDTLRMGQQGDYLSVCHADLAAKASAYINRNTAALVPRAAGTYTWRQLYDFAGASGFVWVTGNLTIDGGGATTLDTRPGSGHKLTVFAEGAITIGSNVAVPSGGTSIGVVAGVNAGSNGIQILPTADRIDAYLFTRGNLYTCYAVTCEGKILTVSGFLMGYNVYLGRGGGNIFNGYNSELVAANNYLYLDAPVLFENDDTVNNLQSVGERPPLQ